MSKIVTRGQLLERMGRTSNKAVSVDSVRRRRFLQEAYNRVWYYLTAGDIGIGLTRREYTIAAPVVALVELPQNFGALRSLVVNPGNSQWQPVLTSDAEQDRLRGNLAPGLRVGTYQVEGPGEDWDEDLLQYVPYSRRLRFYPDLSPGNVVRISYVTQPRTLGDPTIDDDDDVEVDVFSEVVEAVLIDLAVLESAGRGDPKEYARQQGRYLAHLDDYLSFTQVQDQYGADVPDRYRLPPGARWSF
jgi:hypothetical protein